MIELKLTPSHFEELQKRGISLDLIFRLKMLDDGYDDTLSGQRIVLLEKTLIRKGFATNVGEITEEGKQLLASLSSSEDIPKLPKKVKEVKVIEESGFSKWWKTYPGSDTFEYKGRKFKGTRALKVKKVDCEKKIEKILASKEYTIDELVMALKLEISQKAENSIKTGQNKMTFFQNSLTYLNQQTYDPYVELVRAGHKPEETTNKTVSNETFI